MATAGKAKADEVLTLEWFIRSPQGVLLVLSIHFGNCAMPIHLSRANRPASIFPVLISPLLSFLVD
jgi:hypothetical protein